MSFLLFGKLWRDIHQFSRKLLSLLRFAAFYNHFKRPDVAPMEFKAPVPLGRKFFRLFTIEINFAIANNLKRIGIMKIQHVTIYPNIYECVTDII